MDDFILLFVGGSGSGKTTIANLCEERFGMKQVESYTTRERRNDEEHGHTFVGVEAFLKLKHVIASTFYHGNYYGATQEQIDEAQIYVVDPVGMEAFYDNYKGNKRVGVVYFDVPELERFKRMLLRGDDPGEAENRIVNDRKAFAFADVSASCFQNVLTLTDEPVEEVLDKIENFVVKLHSTDKDGGD